MVYCGKPSGACHACRERRTRCDKLPDGCTQCANARRVCPGYRALGDVMFRDVTTNVIRKAKAGEVRAKHTPLRSSTHTPRASVSDGDAEASEEGMEVVAQSSPLQIYSLVPSIDERATGFFVANYVVGSNGPTRGHLDYLGDVFRDESFDEGLLSSMKAVGLAGFAHTTHAPYLIKNARYEYVKAIRHTNIALRSPTTAKKDSTLLTIIILGIFESITGGTQRSLRDWVTHVTGASDVVKLRGLDGIQSITGRRMLVQVTSNLLISCIQQADPVPAHISELLLTAIQTIRGKEMINKLTTGEPAFVVLESMLHFAQLRSDIIKVHETDPLIIMTRCLALDSILENISHNPPTQWYVHTVYTDTESEYIYNGRYHVYYDYVVSQSWNAMRIMRFMLNEMVRDVLTTGATPGGRILEGAEGKYADQLQKSIAIMYAIQDDILYSVPQHLGSVPEESELGKFVNEDSLVRSVWLDFRDRPNEERPLARISGALFLIWPLWFAGTNDTASDTMKRFVVKSLRVIGDKMGIHQAYLLANAVESKIDIEVSI